MASIKTCTGLRSVVRVQRSTRSAMPVVAPKVVRLPRDVRMAAAQPSEGTPSDDFDAFLMQMADKWEKAENKPVVVGYAAGACAALYFSEWLIHLPGLDLLLGFPVQLIGLLAIPVLAVRYFMDGADANKDLSDFTDNLVNKLPGLKK